MVNLLKDYSFIKVGAPAVPKGKKEVVYIIEILGNNIFTTNGNYKKEQLISVIETAAIEIYFNNSQN